MYRVPESECAIAALCSPTELESVCQESVWEGGAAAGGLGNDPPALGTNDAVAVQQTLLQEHRQEVSTLDGLAGGQNPPSSNTSPTPQAAGCRGDHDYKTALQWLPGPRD